MAGLVDEVEGDAETIGAVNNVVRSPTAGSSDSTATRPGFLAGVELAMGRPLAGADVVVVGAGGAAHAVVFACLRAGAARVTVASRTVDAARALLDRFAVGAPCRAVGPGARRPRVRHRASAWRTWRSTRRRSGMIDPGLTIPVDEMRSTATVFDLVYVPAETPLLAAARARGLRAANGSEMLIQQAAIAFERWTGVGGMADVMREAVTPLLADPTVTA